MIDVIKRHGGDHYANIKWGYLLLAISLAYFVALIFYERRRPKYSNAYPIYAHLLIWIVLTAAFSVNLLHEFSEHAGTLLKRLGRFSYVLTTLDLLLALRPNFVNYVYLVGLHKWISRYILFLGSVHLVGFLVKWAVEGNLFKVLRVLNFLGVVIFLQFLVLLVLSIRFYRRKAYNLFYLIHNFTLVVYFGLINFHARPGVTLLTFINVVIVLVQIVFKFNVSSISLRSVTKFGNLSLVEFEKPLNYPITNPGSYLVLKLLSDFRQWVLPAHPFTIINNYEYLNLVVTNTNKFKFDLKRLYTISLPYTSALNLMEFESKNVLIFIGGSGISFAISILNFYRSTKINFGLVWCVKSKRDLALLDRFDLSCDKHLYVTGLDLDSAFVISNEQDDGLIDNIEMGPLNNVDETELDFKKGRPKLEDFEVPDLLITCGPLAMIADAEAYSKHHNIKLLKEHYDY